MTTRKVLDHGYVELVDWMGSDIRIVNAAQASLDNCSASFGARERGILNFLMRDEHGVPFEHAVFTWRLRLPLFLAAQFKKHRMSSWSEQSARYDELEPLAYYPETINTQTGKVGSYTYLPIDPSTADSFQSALLTSTRASFHLYQKALASGVAKEQARLFLPVNTYTTVVWTMNFRAMSNFLHLRTDGHAQYEAQVYARAMEDMARVAIPNTIDLFIEHGRPKL